MDSTTCLYYAHHHHTDVRALSINYGQRHAKEIEYAKRSCWQLSSPHRTLEMAQVFPATLLTGDEALPNVSYDEIKGVSPTYVPFRNGILLSAVAALASAEGPNGPDTVIYFGAHAEDAANWAYPDCTPEFIGSMANAIYTGTYGKVRLATPLEWLGKAGIVKLGESLSVPWDNTWSCYAGGEVHCGECPTCRARKAAFWAAGIPDPTVYAV